jgi:transcriptional regulator
MYVPSHFAETRTEVLQQLIREHAQAVLVTLGSGGLSANHIPFELDPDPAPFGTLRGHVARANPVWHDFSKDVEALVVFQGAQAYISPSWYETKKQTGKVVPTYNYIVVHAHGALRVVQDQAWLRALVERLTNRFEGQKAEPWRVSDAPGEFVDKLLGAIVGLEIPVTRLIGKWKLSQNRPQADRDGVVRGLSESADADQLAMARLVESAPRN